MSKLYKLINEKTKQDIEKNKRISLSRPLLEFGNPEGLMIDFFREIFVLVREQNDIERIKPNIELLSKINLWITGYLNSLTNDDVNNYSENDIFTELRVLICVYFQTYCGYFTGVNLSDEITRNDYIDKNSSFVSKNQKRYYVELDIDQNDLNVVDWEYKTDLPIKNSSVLTFSSVRSESDSNAIVAALHLHKIEYLKNELDFNEIFKLFNDNARKSSAFFKYSKEYLKEQQEERLILYLYSSKPGGSMLCFPNFFSKEANSLEKAIFYYALNACKYVYENYPRYVYLKIKDFTLSEI